MEDYEYILLRKNNVNLFKLPTRNVLGTKGHYLNSWKDNFWAGILLILFNRQETCKSKQRETY